MDKTDFVFDLIRIKRSKKDNSEKHKAIMLKILESHEHLFYAAVILEACIKDDDRDLSNENKYTLHH